MSKTKGGRIPGLQIDPTQTRQSRNENPQALWTAVGRRDRLWGTGILLPQVSAVKQYKAVYGAANQKKFSNSPVSPVDQPLAKEPKDSGYEIANMMAQLPRLHDKAAYNYNNR